MDIQKIFEDAGGTFLNTYGNFVTRASRIKAVLFDWDGVFNAGTKGEGQSSTYSETDALGLNMLRLSFWLSNKKIPYMGIITGQHNKSAIQLAERDRFHTVYSGFLNKGLAFNHFLAENGLEEDEVAYVFDDILDIAIADKCGLRCAVRTNGSPLFEKFITDNDQADYFTANQGNNYAVREVCELLMGVMANYNETIKERIAFSDLYQEYLAERNRIATSYFTAENNRLVVSSK
jgi:3-deoxy-D-manno-octulosonate 8-phosphate phosphatase (KDO 8-P phosphatase)